MTASALLDLCSAAWVARLARHLAARGVAFYAALSYDGRMEWSPAHPLDAAVTAAFNAHQQGDKGFGPALGPEAAAAAERAFHSQGCEVHTAQSPWKITGGDREMHAMLVEGIAGAARETGQVREPDLSAWLDARRHLTGGATCIVGHADLLALPAP